MSAELPRSAEIARQAAAWIVQLGSDDAAERARARQGFADWQALDPRHAQAAARLQAFVAQVQQLGSGPGEASAAQAALDAVRAQQTAARRRLTARVGGALALVVLLAVPAWLTLHNHPPALLWSDMHASSGQWRERRLSDGSQLTLSGVSAVNWRVSDDSRVLELLRGSILVDVAKDAARPFYVQTPLGRIRALGTRFAVTYDSGQVTLEMLESRVAVQTPQQWHSGSEQALVVQAGQRLRLGAEGVAAVEDMDAQGVEQGWRRHELVVQDRPLPEVLEQIARHHPGPVRFDRAALADIRVSGVLPLDDTAQTLRLLQRSFPQLRMRFLASRWVWVDLQPGAS